MPLKAMSYGFSSASFEVMLSAAVRCPAAAGVKAIVIVVLSPAASVVTAGPVRLYSAA